MAESGVSDSISTDVPTDVLLAFENYRQDKPDEEQIDSRRRLEEKLEQRRLERELKEFDFEID